RPARLRGRAARGGALRRRRRSRFHARARGPAGPAVSARRALLLVRAGSLVLGAWGLRWGLPSEFGWAADEVLPADVDTAVGQRFAHGWHAKYPPLHFALLAAASAPVRVAGRALGWEAARVHEARMTAGRVLSLALSLGVLLLVARGGRELGDAVAGVL